MIVVKNKGIIFSIFLVVSFLSVLTPIVGNADVSINFAYAQSPINNTLPTNNTGTVANANNTGMVASGNNPSNFNIATVGDFGCGPEANRTVTNMQSKDPELVLALGDFSYTESSKCWIDLMRPFGNETKITLGNHEWPFSLMMEYVYQFNLSRPYYSFNFNNVHVLALSNEFAFDKHSPQYDFAEDDLQKASVDPAVDWIVVFYHKPIYSSHLAESLSQFRNAYHPLFEEFGVDLALQGHIHNYERTYPIEYNTESRRAPITTNATLGNETWVDPRGPIIATVGTGGFSIHPFKSGQAAHVADQYLGYGFLDINFATNNTSTVLTGTFYSNDGQIQDQFKILKPSLFALTNTQGTSNQMTNNPYAEYDNPAADEPGANATGTNAASANAVGPDTGETDEE